MERSISLPDARRYSLEREDARRCRPEAARVDVEVAQVLLEVDVEPFAAGRARVVGGDRDELLADAAAPRGGGDHRVLDPGVDDAVPDDVDEADERGAVARDDPAEAVRCDLLAPVPLRLVVDLRPERLGVEAVDLVVAEPAAPLVADHGRDRTEPA